MAITRQAQPPATDRSADEPVHAWRTALRIFTELDHPAAHVVNAKLHRLGFA
jgi:hypothetical protein